MNYIDLTRFFVTFSILGYASYKDWKFREIDNWPWSVMGIAGILSFIIYYPATIYSYVNLIPLLAVILSFFGPVFEWDEVIKLPEQLYFVLDYGTYIISFLLFAIYYYIAGMTTIFDTLFIVLLMFVFIRVLYEMSIIHGGADAKALMALSFLYFNIPSFFIFPLIKMPSIFPFAFMVLFNAVLISVFIPIFFIFYNIKHNDLKFPQFLFGYRIPVEHVKKSFVWLMEFPENKIVLFPSKIEDGEVDSAIEKFTEQKKEKVWVTPQLPFIIFIYAGFILQSLFLSPLLLIFHIY